MGAAAPKVEKVEPPNWLVPHTYNPLPILLTGSDRKGAGVSTLSNNIKPHLRYTSDDRRYPFLYLDIGRDARPCEHRWDVKSASGNGRLHLPPGPAAPTGVDASRLHPR
jgi:hypothetical protein